MVTHNQAYFDKINSKTPNKPKQKPNHPLLRQRPNNRRHVTTDELTGDGGSPFLAKQLRRLLHFRPNHPPAPATSKQPATRNHRRTHWRRWVTISGQTTPATSSFPAKPNRKTLKNTNST
jgi:hypothetical protein